MVKLEKLKTIVFYETNRYSIHAEVACLISCKYKNLIPKSIMYIVKIHEGEPKIWTPCSSCLKFIQKYKVKRYILKK